MNEVRAARLFWRKRSVIIGVIKSLFLVLYQLALAASVEYPRARLRLAITKFRFRRERKAELAEVKSYQHIVRN